MPLHLISSYHMYLCIFMYAYAETNVRMSSSCRLNCRKTHTRGLCKTLPPSWLLLTRSCQLFLLFVALAIIWIYLVYSFALLLTHCITRMQDTCGQGPCLSSSCWNPVTASNTSPDPELTLSGRFLGEWMNEHWGFWANTQLAYFKIRKAK